MSPRRKDATNGAPGGQPPIEVHTTVTQSQPPPAKDGEKPERPDFWSYMLGLTAEEWRDHIVYLTRESPKSGVSGIGGYLAKMTEPFDVEDIKLKYGGYDFSYIMKKSNMILYKGKFHIEAQPILDLSREQHNNQLPPANAGPQADLVKEFITTLRDELARSREQNDNPNNDRALDLFAKAAEKSMDMVQARATSAGGGLRETIEIAKLLQPPPQKSIVEQLVELASSPILKPLIEKLSGLFTPPDPAAEFTKLGTMITAIDAIRGTTGAGGGGPKDWKAALADGLINKAPEILQGIRDTAEVSARAAADRRAASEATERTAHVVGTRPPLPPGAPGAPPMDPNATVSPLQTVPIVAQPEVAHPAAVAGAPAVDPNADVIAAFIKQRLVAMFNEKREPDEVVEFLDNADPGICDQLVAYPAPAVTAYLMSDPILRPMVEHADWPAFLDKCRAYIDASAQPETESRPV